jgi:CBS domain-containing protein
LRQRRFQRFQGAAGENSAPPAQKSTSGAPSLRVTGRGTGDANGDECGLGGAQPVRRAEAIMNEFLSGNGAKVYHLARFEHGVVVAQLDESAGDVARRMRDFHVGCVVVIRGDRSVGILTDRDLALRVVAEGRDPEKTKVSDIVTYEATTVSREAGIETAVRLMRDHGVRRLPIVTEDGQVTGIVTADDLVVLLTDELANVGMAIKDNVDSGDSR